MRVTTSDKVREWLIVRILQDNIQLRIGLKQEDGKRSIK